MKEQLKAFAQKHMGLLIGSGVGLLLGMMLLILGVFPTLLLLVCVGIGALIGGVPPVRSWITGQITKWLDKLINKF